MRVIFRLLLVAALLGAVFGGIYQIKHRQALERAARQSAPRPPAPVASTTARTEHWRPEIRAIGTLVAVNGVAITTEVAGTIRKFGFRSSERVTAGDVLVRLDDAVDRAVLQGLIADRELARVQLERATKLLSQKAMPKSDFDTARFRYQGAEARVEEQRTRIAKKTIRAPFDGLLGLRLVDLGEYVSPGARIVELDALDPIYVDYSVPEREFGNLQTGQKVVARVPAHPERDFSGTISAIDSGVDKGTRSIAVRATIANPDGALRPGMFAEVRTLRPELREVITLPRTAISFNTYGDYVYVIEKGDGGALEVARRQVITGATRKGRVEMVSGIEAGERVVRAGLLKLHDGQRIAIDDSVKLDDAAITRE